MKKVISGMQTGADIAGVKAAKDLGIPTGGFMPKGYRTETADRPEYKSLYNAEVVSSTNYLERTQKNVFSSDGTVIFDYNLSTGSINTKRFCIAANKPYLYLTRNEINNTALTTGRIVDFIKSNNIQILNVAGNRESKAKGIEQRVYKILTEVFKILL